MQPSDIAEEFNRIEELVAKNMASVYCFMTSTISRLKFFFDITLNHPERMAKMQPVTGADEWAELAREDTPAAPLVARADEMSARSTRIALPAI